MTILALIGVGLSQKIVMDRSMTIFSLREWVITENCHWQVNDIFWGSPIGSWSKQRIIDLSFWLWTYHLWPNVIDGCQWQKFMDIIGKKMSLTIVNDKKIVIYWKWSIPERDATIQQKWKLGRREIGRIYAQDSRYSNTQTPIHSTPSLAKARSASLSHSLDDLIYILSSGPINHSSKKRKK